VPTTTLETATTTEPGAFHAPTPVIVAVEPKTKTTTQPSIPLTSLRRGQQATITTNDQLDPADAQTLRAMGLRKHTTLTLCNTGRTTVVAIGCGCGCSCRIGIDKQLAQRINVTPLQNN